jgi:hypothetical protein
MGGIFGGGGGGGSPPKIPPLKQVSTSLTGPLYKTAQNMAGTWNALMRQDYGFTPGGPAWRAPLGQGAMALQSQAAEPWAGKQDTQVTGTLQSAFGAPRFGGAGAGSSWDLGSTPFEVARNLGQDPLAQLQRGQQFTTGLLKQWAPPSPALPLTGADLLSVAMQQQAANAQQQQQAFQQQLAASNIAAQSSANAQALGTAAIGKIGAGAINALGNYNWGGGGGVNTGINVGGMQVYNALGYDPSQVQSGGTSFMGTGGGQ